MFLALRGPVMYHQPGGYDEDFYAVPGLTILQSGIPRLPHVPARNPESVFYHGDTALCAFGPGRRQLLVYRQALAPEGFAALQDVFKERLLELDEADAQRYAANSFALHQGGEHHLLMPQGVSERLQAEVRERGARPMTVDVSEFLKKGGGSVKCMIGDLGPVRGDRIVGSYAAQAG